MNGKAEMIEMGLDSIYVWIILVNSALTLLGWVWCMWINKRQRVGSFNMGNLLYAASYALLIDRNLGLYSKGSVLRDGHAIMLTLVISLCQLGAVCWFVITYYWNRQQKNGWGGERELGAFDAQMDKRT